MTTEIASLNPRIAKNALARSTSRTTMVRWSKCVGIGPNPPNKWSSVSKPPSSCYHTTQGAQHMSHPRIKRDPKVMMGKPVVAGTRITVEHILRCLAAGDTIEHMIANYPHLTVEDIRAAQAYAADYLAHEGIVAAE